MSISFSVLPPLCCSLTDNSHPEGNYRLEGVSVFSQNKETVMGRCFLVSFVPRGQCRRYERRYGVKIYRIGSGLRNIVALYRFTLAEKLI